MGSVCVSCVTKNNGRIPTPIDSLFDGIPSETISLSPNGKRQIVNYEIKDDVYGLKPVIQ